MYYAENLLDRFRSVSALAQRGVGGEQTNAANILRDMETKYPGIGAQAFPQTVKNDAPHLGPYSAASGNFGGGAGAPPREARWDRFRNAATDALGWAARMAADIAAAKEVDQVVERLVEVQAKNLSSGKFQVSVRFPAEEMAYYLSRLNEVQRAALVEKLTALFREEMTAAFTPGEDER